MIDGNRGTGRTYKMLLKAAEASLFTDVIIIAATRNEAHGIAQHFEKICSRYDITPTGKILFLSGYDFDAILRGYPEEVPVFIDHHAYETAIYWLPLWKNKRLAEENTKLRERLAKIKDLSSLGLTKA